MFGGFGTKFSLIARKIVAQAQQIGAWPAWFGGQAVPSVSSSYSGEYLRNTSDLPITILGNENGTKWRSISPGRPNSGGVKSDGTLWVWGGQFAGEHGIPVSGHLNSPLQVGTSTDWAYFQRRRRGSLGLKSDGTLFSWGRAIGNGLNYNGGIFSSPVQIGSSGEWQKIFAGDFNSFAIKKNGTLWTWGRNSFSSTGLNYAFCEFPVQVGTGNNWTTMGKAYNCLAIRNDGTLWFWGVPTNTGVGAGLTSSSTPTQIGTDTNWSKVCISSYHSAWALKTNGTLWAWGANSFGQLGLGDVTVRSSPVQVGADTDWASINDSNGLVQFGSFFAIKTNGTLWAWGRNNVGQLGLGDATNRSSPVQVGTDTNWASVHANGNTTFARKTTGSIWSWGQDGNVGLLGHGSILNGGRSSPIQIGTGTDWSRIFAPNGFRAAAIKTNGTMWAWGQNNRGQLGLGNTTNRSIPVQVGADTDWATVSGHWTTNLSVKTNGTIWYAGDPVWIAGNLGPFSFSFPLGPSSMTAASKLAGHTGWNELFSVGTGVNGTVHGIKPDGTLWTWGGRRLGSSPNSGLTGFYGPQNEIEIVIPTQIGTDNDWSYVSTAAYTNHTLFLKTNGTLWSCGRNYRYGLVGWLGHPGATTTSRMLSRPTQIGTDTNWKSILAIPRSSFAIKTDGTLWAWGDNGVGSIPTGSSTSPRQVGSSTDWSTFFANTEISNAMALKTDGTLWAWGRQGFALGRKAFLAVSPTQLGTGTDWSENFTMGNFHIHAVKNNGTLWGWGRNNLGQLGLGDVTNRSSPVQVGADTNWSKLLINQGEWTAAIKTDGTLWTWGTGKYGKLGQNSTTNRSSPVQVGTDVDWARGCATKDFMAAIKTNGTLWTWGRNANGQLGHNNTTTRSSPVQVGTDTNWSKICCASGNYNMDAAGYEPFCVALRTNGTLWTWGANSYGQLGQGNTTPRSSPVQIGTASDWKSALIAVDTSRRHTVRAIKTNGTLWGWGGGGAGGGSSPVQVGTDTDWNDFMNEVGGTYGPFAIKKTNGQVWTFGTASRNFIAFNSVSTQSAVLARGGETGWTTSTSTISCNWSRKDNGTLWLLGSNQRQGIDGGALGTGPFAASQTSSPAQVGTDTDWKGGAVTGYEGLNAANWWIGLKGS